ncbi:MAG: DUF721 domain-containing protein [Akkermansia sp.]|nr:DUF721 domain-containing protein [Akkermansia sp.]
MPAPRRRVRKAAPVEPVQAPPPVQKRREPAGLYHEEMFSDGSVRPVRNTTRSERESGQAMADFFGVQPQLNPATNVRSMESVLASLVSKMDISLAEHAPEVLADAWARAVGPFLATKAELLSIARGQARIRTSHPAVRFELTRQKAQIIRALNAALGDGSVKTVQIVHG